MHLGYATSYGWWKDGRVWFQAHNKALDKILEKKLIEREDYDGIRKLMTKAYEVGSRGGGLQDKDLSKVSDKPEFLIDGRFPKGGITFVAGRGGAGKGAFITGGIGSAVTKAGIIPSGLNINDSSSNYRNIYTFTCFTHGLKENLKTTPQENLQISAQWSHTSCRHTIEATNIAWTHSYSYKLNIVNNSVRLA